MGGWIGQPMLDIDFLNPGRASFDTIGSAVDGGRNGLGESNEIEFSGGGVVICSYEGLAIHDPEQHEIITWLGARLNGGHCNIVVQILQDWAGPFPEVGGVKTPIVGGIPHVAGPVIDNGSGSSGATVWGKVTAAAAQNAGLISMRLYSAARDLRWSDWFSIYHPVKGWRVYRCWQIESKSAVGSQTIGGISYAYRDYTLAIAPPLRQAVTADEVTAGKHVELARPRCVMKWPKGFTLPHEFEGFWQASPTLRFVEA